ncbi:nitrate- and nitrite sensing domain-containing protein [Enterobacteriaceae bacterium H20N1]|uniref:Nitrate- and nitrite sensing domain-containing protein n=1 Tax=Dryocola boscaweniae TaxID=2925397 RepID=A0A9X3AE17_9ENTR|nr:nitrate- and nitrite sensing domain-containing protein [Dryocola boscaweniae]MCT4703593.1 nitrate- and nitrite sensing domain-containing protein [Dryocola boscaweniae]MCT4720761.1 nitrate- and nitrite sensing domain-containing protein [Dryocola boscaweniae]
MIPTARDFLIAARTRGREQLQDILQIGQLTGRIARLAHMLQRERGASNIWLCSAGNLFGDERKSCAQEVDGEMTHFRQAIAQPDYLPGSALFINLACALHYLERLPALREKISAQQITPSEAMEQFNCTLRHLLSIVPETSNAVEDAGVARALAALFSFMQGKEFAGQERAIGALGFTQGTFNDALRQQLADRIDSQQRCFEAFCSMADEPLRLQYQSSGEPCRETERLRRLACTRLSADEAQPERALQWFAVLTARIDALRKVEEMLIEAVMAQAQRALGQVLHETPLSETEIANWVAGHASNDGERYLDRHLLPLVRQQAQQLETMAQQLASLQATLEERKVIDKAKALLIRHQGYSEEQAWQTLRKMAMNQNKRMVDVAHAMVSVADIWQLPIKE